jgi:hypothetical protein
MYSDTKVNEELTKITYGYNSSDLKKGSHEKIVVTCCNCNRNIHREHRNLHRKHSCPSVEGENKRCFKCLEWKDLSAFAKNPKGSGGVAKVCKNCYNKYDSVIKADKNKLYKKRNCFEDGDIDYYIKTRMAGLKSRAKRSNLEFKLEGEFMINLYKQQNGMCYYTGIQMNQKYKSEGFQSWDCPSVDRIDSSKGYVKDNVVWCCFGVNSFKQSLSIEDFEKLIRSANWWFNKNP